MSTLTGGARPSDSKASQRRRVAIAEATLSLLRTRDAAEVAVSDIAAEAGVSAQFGECQVTDHEIRVGTTIEFEVPVTNGSSEQDIVLSVDFYYRDEFYIGWGMVRSFVPPGLSFVVTEEITFEDEIDGSLLDWSCEVIATT